MEFISILSVALVSAAAGRQRTKEKKRNMARTKGPVSFRFIEL